MLSLSNMIRFSNLILKGMNPVSSAIILLVLYFQQRINLVSLLFIDQMVTFNQNLPHLEPDYGGLELYHPAFPNLSNMNWHL
jgi:hypothetical protein